MSWPACMWPGRASPYAPVTGPLTGVAMRPLPQPPLATGAATGVVDCGFVVAARFVAGSVDVFGAVVAGIDGALFLWVSGEAVVGACRVVVRVDASGAAVPPEEW